LIGIRRRRLSQLDAMAEHRFSGRIKKVTLDGAGGVVDLDSSIGSIRYAVIGQTAKGVIELMNGEGKLHEGTRVQGYGIIQGSGLKVTSVERAKDRRPGEVVDLSDARKKGWSFPLLGRKHATQ